MKYTKLLILSLVIFSGLFGIASFAEAAISVSASRDQTKMDHTPHLTNSIYGPTDPTQTVIVYSLNEINQITSNSYELSLAMARAKNQPTDPTVNYGFSLVLGTNSNLSNAQTFPIASGTLPNGAGLVGNVGYSYTINISGLSPNSTYYFKIVDNKYNTNSPIISKKTTTAAGGGSNHSIIIFDPVPPTNSFISYESFTVTETIDIPNDTYVDVVMRYATKQSDLTDPIKYKQVTVPLPQSYYNQKKTEKVSVTLEGLIPNANYYYMFYDRLNNIGGKTYVVKTAETPIPTFSNFQVSKTSNNTANIIAVVTFPNYVTNANLTLAYGKKSEGTFPQNVALQKIDTLEKSKPVSISKVISGLDPAVEYNYKIGVIYSISTTPIAYSTIQTFSLATAGTPAQNTSGKCGIAGQGTKTYTTAPPVADRCESGNVLDFIATAQGWSWKCKMDTVIIVDNGVICSAQTGNGEPTGKTGTTGGIDLSGDPANTNNPPGNTPGSTNNTVDVNTETSDGLSNNFLRNPFKNLDSFPKIIAAVINNIILPIAVPFIAVMIMYSGFLFVQGRSFGNADGIKKAKETFYYTMIGAVLMLGAFVIANALQGTLNELINIAG